MPDINPAGWIVPASANNATATATKAVPAAAGGKKNVVFGVDASFSAAPTAPVLLQIKDGATVIWEGYVSAPVSRQFKRGLAITPGNACSAVLAASGTGGTIGKVNLDGVEA